MSYNQLFLHLVDCMTWQIAKVIISMMIDEPVKKKIKCRAELPLTWQDLLLLVQLLVGIFIFLFSFFFFFGKRSFIFSLTDVGTLLYTYTCPFWSFHFLCFPFFTHLFPFGFNLWILLTSASSGILIKELKKIKKYCIKVALKTIKFKLCCINHNISKKKLIKFESLTSVYGALFSTPICLNLFYVSLPH
jgi:hypothetical protein